MIAPKDDNCIVAQTLLVQGIEQLSHLRIHVTHASVLTVAQLSDQGI